MALPNNDPIYSRSGDIQSSAFGDGSAGAVIGPTANTALDGTGTAIYPVFQSDTTNGGYVQRIRFKAVGSPALTVARVFICNVTGAFTPNTSNTAATTVLYDEITLQAVTGATQAATPTYELPLNFALPAGFRILVAFGASTGAAGTGYVATVIGGKY